MLPLVCLQTMRNDQRVDPEDDHYYITGAAIEKEEKTTDNGIIFVRDKPIAFSTVDSE